MAARMSIRIRVCGPRRARSVSNQEGGPSRELRASFKIAHPAFHGRALVLAAESPAEHAQWMRAVMNCRLMCVG